MADVEKRPPEQLAQANVTIDLLTVTGDGRQTTAGQAPKQVWNGEPLDMAQGDPLLTTDRPLQQQGTGSDTRQDPGYRALVDSADFRRTVDQMRSDGLSGPTPEQTVVDLLSRNRVVAFGEAHETPNPLRNFAADNFEAMVRAGATHLAIEAFGGTNLHDAIAEFNRTGDVDKLKLAYPQDAREHDDYFNMLTRARDAGLQIFAADDPHTQDGYSKTRDTAMAGAIQEVLRDPNARVVAWFGADHLARENGSAADVLRRNGVALATVHGVIPTSGSGLHAAPLAELSGRLDRPIAVDASRYPMLQNIPTAFAGRRNYPEGDFDRIIIFPER